MAIEIAAIKGQVREFVWDYSQTKGIAPQADDELLIKQSTMNSLGVFRLISFLEDTFPIVIEDTDILPENFETINAIEGFILRKMGVATEEMALAS
jgi:acyl carrier protein